MTLIQAPKNFPLNLTYYILSYVHKPQSKELLDDITHYYNSKSYVICHYRLKFINSNINSQHLLLILIRLYFNNFIEPMYGYVNDFYKKLLRLPIINPEYRENLFGTYNKDYTYNSYIFMQKLKILRIKTQINILWGIMTINERNIFIDTFSDV